MHVIALKIDHTSITGFVMETVPTRKFILSWSLLNEQATDVAQVQLTFMWRRCSSHSLALPFSYSFWRKRHCQWRVSPRHCELTVRLTRRTESVKWNVTALCWNWMYQSSIVICKYEQRLLTLRENQCSDESGKIIDLRYQCQSWDQRVFFSYMYIRSQTRYSAILTCHSWKSVSRNYRLHSI